MSRLLCKALRACENLPFGGSGEGVPGTDILNLFFDEGFVIWDVEANVCRLTDRGRDYLKEHQPAGVAKSGKCGPDCKHTAEEHAAFDEGYEHGASGKRESPPADAELRSAYTEGHHAGSLTFEQKEGEE